MTKYAKCSVCGYTVAIPDDKAAGNYVCPVDGTTLEVATRAEYMVAENYCFKDKDWTVYASNPVLTGVKECCVKWVPAISKYRMWATNSAHTQTKLYDSVDGVSWTEKGTLQKSTGGNLNGAFCNVSFIDETYYIVYTSGGIYAGTLSDDGLTVTILNSGNAILTGDAGIPWEASQSLCNPALSYKDSTWFLLYESWGVIAITGLCNAIGLATGADLGSLVKYVNNPVLSSPYGYSACGNAESHKLEGTDKYAVFYGAWDDEGALNPSILYAVTEDFINFDLGKCKNPIMAGAMGGNNCDPTVVSLPSQNPKTRLWFYQSADKIHLTEIDLDLQELTSYALDIHKSYVTAIGRESMGKYQRNLLKNTSFEVYPDGLWEVHGNVIRTKDNSIFRYGDASCKIQANGTGSSIQYVLPSKELNYIKGKTVTVGMAIYCPTSNTAAKSHIRIWYSVSGSPVKLESGKIPRKGKWIWYTMTLAVPAGSLYFKIQPMIDTGLNNTDVLYIDGVTLVEGDECYEYIPETISAGDAVAGTINHSGIFTDVLAASANYIVNAQNLVNGGVVLTGTQPKYPRGLDCTITEVGGNVTDYTMTVVGTDAKGNSITEVFIFADDGLTFSSDNAFDHITSVTLADVVDVGNATFVMGIDKRLGLENVIYETGSIWKIIKNGTKQIVAAAQINTDYGTYDMSVIGLAATDDFTIFYKSNLNIIS